MHGSYLLDTNIIIYAINRRLTLPVGDYAISIITEMELLSFPRLTAQEESNLGLLFQAFDIFGIDHKVKLSAIDIRRKTSLKLPDSIIAATALEHQLSLVTNDARLSENHPGHTLSLEELLNN